MSQTKKELANTPLDAARLLAPALAVAALTLAQPGHAEDVDALSQTCVACHGIDGISPDPLWPNLAGQKAGYAAAQLRAFRDGEREDPLMSPAAMELSDKQIEALAAHYETLPPAKGKGKPDAEGRHLSAHCISCHGMKGKTVNTEWPNIANQKAAYMAKRLRAFRDQAPPNSVMSVVMQGFSDEQIDAVARHYSQFRD